MNPDLPLMKTYAWYEGDLGKPRQCYFISTIERDSSGSIGGRFAETIAWEFDWEQGERGRSVFEDGCPVYAAVAHHCDIAAYLADGKTPKLWDDDDE